MEVKYLYEVHPSRIIRRPGKPPLRHPASMLLTKEEVLDIMDYGRVYRKPAKSIEAILVTGDNIDKLHVDDSLIDLTGLTKVASEKYTVLPNKDTTVTEIDETDTVEDNSTAVDVDEEPVKNLEGEALSVDGEEDNSTTVELDQHQLPDIGDSEESMEREYEPTVIETPIEESVPETTVIETPIEESVPETTVIETPIEESVPMPEIKENDITVIKIEEEVKEEVPVETTVQRPQNKSNNISFQSNGQNNYHKNNRNNNKK